MSPVGGVRSGVFGSGVAMPAPVVTQYRYEDDSDTTTAIDSIGNNNATVSGATFTGTAAVGSLALSHDGSNDQTESDSDVDLASLGNTDGMSLSAFWRLESFGGLANNYHLWWGPNSNNFVALVDDGSSVIEPKVQVGGSEIGNTISFAPSTGTWYHVYIEFAADGSVDMQIDGSSQGTETSGLDPTNIGSGPYATGYSPGFNGNYGNSIIDDFSPASDPLSNDEIQTLIDRAN